MDISVVSFPTPEKNVLFDEALFKNAEDGLCGETLRFWESVTPFIVLGKTSKEDQEINFENVNKDKIPIVRRCSAGGVVVQGKGCLNFVLVLSRERKEIQTIASSYAFILENVIFALKKLGVRARFYPPCELALVQNDKKFSGNAQRRGKKFILHHGTILYNFDISLAEKYLLFPPKVPFYRKCRSHGDFMTNIDAHPKEIMEVLAQAFKARTKRRLSVSRT
jgi:lipoate-protein ligase A